MTKPPTLADVARLAGVSVSTASRILNGGVRGAKSGLSDTRKRVTDAARALGYAASPAAQATKGGRSRSVALLVGDIEDYGSSAIISGVIAAAETRGVSVTVRTTRDEHSREVELLHQLRAERHRAVIVATTRTIDPGRENDFGAGLRSLREHGAAVVIIGDSDLGFPHVTVDNRGGARTLARLLVAEGARQFLIVAGPEAEITSRERLAGFVEGLSGAGLHDDAAVVTHTEFSRDGGHRAVRRLGDKLEDFDTIAAMSDALAVGAIAALWERGLESPRDVEVTGFDNVPILSDVMHRFSTVEVPLRAFGEAALSLAFDDDVSSSERILLLPTVVVHGQRHVS